MTGRIGIGKVILGVIFLGFLVGPVAAEWDVSVASHPNSAGGSIFTSDGKNTVVFLEIVDEQGYPIKPSDVTDDSYFYYEYNKTSPNENLSHFQGSYWYAEFDADLTQHGVSRNKAEILFEVQGDKTADDDVASGGLKTDTAVLQVGNYTVDIEEAPEMPLEPGETANISVNVTDREGVSAPGIEEVNVAFKNSTFSNSAGNLNYNSSSGLYEGGVTVPPAHDREYLMTVMASNQSGSGTYGAVSRFVNTTEDIDGRIENLTLGVGCESLGQGLPPRCEPGGSIDLSFNVTGIEVDSVTLSTHKVNRSSGEQIQIFNRSLEESEGLYSSQFDVPEINTTAFLDQVFVKVNMTKGDRSEVVEEVVNYRSIDMEHLATGSAYQGGDYLLQVQARRPVSFSPYGESGIHELRVNVTDSDGDLYENFTKSDFVFDEEDMVFEKAVDIASDADPGGWGLEIFGAKYSQTDTVEAGFSVGSSDATFDVNDTEFLVDERGEQEFTMEVENLLENNITLRSNLSSELKPLMNISGDGRFNVSAGESEGVPVTVDMTDLSDDVLGEVNFTDVDTGFERQASVFLATPGCEVVNGSLCGTREKWINVSVDSRNTTTEELEIFYTAGEGNSTDITVSKSGPIAQFIEINRTEYNITDSVTIDLNYTAGERGNFTGNIVIDAENGSTIVYNTSLDANVTQLGSILTVENSPVDFGVIPEGSSGSVDVQLQNSAGYTIQNLIARSPLMDVSIEGDNVNIQGGSSKTVTVTYSDISSLGTVEITGTRPQGSNATTSFTAGGSTVENYSQQTTQLETRIDQLSPVSDTNLSDTLQRVNGLIGEIRDEWSNGNYADARDTYQQADQLLTYVSNNKGTSDEGEDNEDRDTENPDNEEQNDQNPDGTNQDQNQQQQNEGGGLPIIPIVVVLLIIVVIGVVVYESYIPEEGDPLYDLLGEE